MRHEWESQSCGETIRHAVAVEDGERVTYFRRPAGLDEWLSSGLDHGAAVSEILRLAARVQELERAVVVADLATAGADAFASEALEDRDRSHRALNDASDRIAALEKENRRLREKVENLGFALQEEFPE